MMGPPTAKPKSPELLPKGASVASIPNSASSKNVAPNAKKVPPGSKFAMTPGMCFA